MYDDDRTPPRGIPASPPPPRRHSLQDTGPHDTPPWMRGAPPREPRNGLGVTALVLAVLSILTGLIPLLWLPAAGLAVASIACAAVAYGRVRRQEATNKRTVIFALITGAVGAVLSIVAAVLFFSAFAELDRSLQDLDAELQSSGPPPAAPAPIDPTPVTERSGVMDGTYLVGEDIEPGTYRTAGAASDASWAQCYYARLSGTSGELGDVISNDLSQGPSVVTIRESDTAFETNGCQPWEPQ